MGTSRISIKYLRIKVRTNTKREIYTLLIRQWLEPFLWYFLCRKSEPIIEWERARNSAVEGTYFLINELTSIFSRVSRQKWPSKLSSSAPHQIGFGCSDLFVKFTVIHLNIYAKYVNWWVKTEQSAKNWHDCLPCVKICKKRKNVKHCPVNWN